jgi:AAA family ATP:ADP antiporter
LARRVAWRVLFPSAALFFALNLVFFRIFYVPGSAAFGMIFYGWYDLFSAALVTQFFMAAQLFFNARSAKQAYPLVIGGGALGATLGGVITGLTAERLGTPNLMLLAAAFIVLFAAGLPFIYRDSETARHEHASRSAAAIETLWNNKHVRLIAISVLLTIIVKELVDYQFNALSKEVYVTRDAVAAFQGKFNAVTQWLPLVFVLLLSPLLKRFGVGLAILLLPAALLLTSAGLIVWWGLASPKARRPHYAIQPNAQGVRSCISLCHRTCGSPPRHISTSLSKKVSAKLSPRRSSSYSCASFRISRLLMSR